MVSCPQCKAQLPDNAAFCPFCGLRIFVAKPGQPVSLHDNLLGALAYVTFIPAIIFLLTEKFKRNPFVRFHSVQSLFMVVAAVLIGIFMRLIYSLFVLVPWLGFLLAWLSIVVVILAIFMTWIVMIIKAFQGERCKLPFIGNFAESI